jgi:hypothetical protein
LYALIILLSNPEIIVAGVKILESSVQELNFKALSITQNSSSHVFSFLGSVLFFFAVALEPKKKRMN